MMPESRENISSRIMIIKNISFERIEKLPSLRLFEDIPSYFRN